ncbi:MAG: hypothetical protein ACRDQ5_16770 [Sciscionella sp.]
MAVRIQACADTTNDHPVIGVERASDPEPHALYQLIRLTFIQHGPAASTGCCAACGADWPCPTVRLAFRLREAF